MKLRQALCIASAGQVLNLPCFLAAQTFSVVQVENLHYIWQAISSP
jgi:hypothetical protein